MSSPMPNSLNRGESPLAEGRELKFWHTAAEMPQNDRSPLAEGRELKFVYAAIMAAGAIVAPRGGA